MPGSYLGGSTYLGLIRHVWEPLLAHMSFDLLHRTAGLLLSSLTLSLISLWLYLIARIESLLSCSGSTCTEPEILWTSLSSKSIYSTDFSISFPYVLLLLPICLTHLLWCLFIFFKSFYEFPPLVPANSYCNALILPAFEKPFDLVWIFLDLAMSYSRWTVSEKLPAPFILSVCFWVGEKM